MEQSKVYSTWTYACSHNHNVASINLSFKCICSREKTKKRREKNTLTIICIKYWNFNLLERNTQITHDITREFGCIHLCEMRWTFNFKISWKCWMGARVECRTFLNSNESDSKWLYCIINKLEMLTYDAKD